MSETRYHHVWLEDDDDAADIVMPDGSAIIVSSQGCVAVHSKDGTVLSSGSLHDRVSPVTGDGRAAYERAYDAQVNGEIGLPSGPYEGLPQRDRDAWDAIAAAGACCHVFTTSELVLLLDAVMVHYRHVATIPENDPSNLPPLEALQHKIEASLKTVLHAARMWYSKDQEQIKGMEETMTWFSSDTHFLHKLVSTTRGFASPEEHDEAVIANWNKLVKPDDLVWHLGDVGIGNEDKILAQAARLNGRKQLIAGNHDLVWAGHRDARKHQRKWLEVFDTVQPFAAVNLGMTPWDGKKRRVLLSHFPYEGDHTSEDRGAQFRLRDEGLWLLHGHVHSAEWHEWPAKTIHVGLDAWDLKPVHENEVLALITRGENG
jgi:calcineurin-like phosphoesterase family protein